MTATLTSMSSSSNSRNGLKNSGRPSQDFVTLADIRREVDKKTKVTGFAALAILGNANTQADVGKTKEDSGDIPGAILHYLNALSLFNSAYEHREYKQETVPGKQGAIYRDVHHFKTTRLPDLNQRVRVLMSRQKELEDHHKPSDSQDPSFQLDGPDQQPGGTLRDRMKLLQDAGMSADLVPKRPRDRSPSSPLVQSSVGTPTPPTPSGFGIPSPPHTPSNTLSPTFPPSTTSTAPSTPHSFVSLSTLGPPSPTSSASSSASLPTSPRHYNLASISSGASMHVPSPSEFASQFPSIDELDERDSTTTLPSVPTISPSSFPPVPQATVGSLPPPISPTVRKWPVLSQEPTARPASTPIPFINALSNSRPPTPPPRPSPSVSRPLPPPSPPAVLTQIPISNAISPKDLYPLLQSRKILLIDVRPRVDFDQAHIKHSAILCLEPTVLTRNNISASQIHESLVLSPQTEATLFENRNKFDHVVIYDQKSTKDNEIDPSPIAALVRAIYEWEFRAVLKKPPMLLIGGFDGWVREYGEAATEGTDTKSALHRGQDIPKSGLEARLPSMGLGNVPRPLGPRPATGMSVNQTVSILASGSGNGLPESRDLLTETPPRSPAPETPDHRKLVRKPTLHAGQISARYSNDPYATLHASSSTSSLTSGSSLSHGISTIQYPAPAMSSPITPYRPSPPPSAAFAPTAPPQASLNGSPLSRRRSDYAEQAQHSYSGSIPITRTPIDYPQLLSHQVIRPPPAAATPTLERQDQRPRMGHVVSYSTGQLHAPPPLIKSDYPVTFWRDTQIGTSGLKNLGNTCYMNSILQCLSATVPFTQFFTDGRWKTAVNQLNPLGTRGVLAHAFAKMVHEMWQGDQVYIAPYPFRKSICNFAPQFGGSDQHDSQEFLSFLLDGLHEDLNRVLAKPQIETRPEREAELETLPQQIASEQEWRSYRMRNDSIVVDYFQGQFRNRLQCLTCNKTSTTYNTFMYLSLPIPSGRKATLAQCLDAFVKEEVMEKTDAWNCPNCKGLRKATKLLSLSRLPPILMIHLKRFSFEGPFTDKLETLVDFPLKGLDLTNYMPAPLPPGIDKSQIYGQQSGPSHTDPRSQIPPYRYDLYGVTNHFGSLSSGHYTAYIASAGGWRYCDDSRITKADKSEVVGKPAYILFYKRVPP